MTLFPYWGLFRLLHHPLKVRYLLVWSQGRVFSSKVRILCLNFSLNLLRFSLTRETDTKMTRAKSWAIFKTSILKRSNWPKHQFCLLTKCLKSVHFKKPVTRISFLSKVLSFSLKSKQSYIENDNAFERNEICVTGFLKWTDFNRTSELILFDAYPHSN